MTNRIEVAITSGSGKFQGRRSSISQYSVDESITPLDASAGDVGVGTISFGAVETIDSMLLQDNAIKLTDGARGYATGSVRSTDGSGALTVTADSTLSITMATKTAQPYSGSLGGAIAYYLSLVNRVSDFQVEDTIASREVILPGWSGNVLSYLTELCIAQQIEMTVVHDDIVFRETRKNLAIGKRLKSPVSHGTSRGSPAQSVQIYCYHYHQITNTVVYPSPLENARDSFQVGPNQTLEPTRVQIAATLSSVNQPLCLDFLGPGYDGADGAYVVTGTDGLVIPSAEWAAKGGALSVQIDPEAPDYLIINVTGMNEPDDIRAPYSVGAMQADGETYAALYITGEGVAYDKELLSIGTGATSTEREDSPIIDNFAISTRAQAFTAAQKAVSKYSGTNITISAEAVAVNRPGSGNEFATSKLSAFDDEFAGQKLQALDDKGWKFQDFDDHYADLVAQNFENQLFGNAGGARFFDQFAYYRIDRATITEQSTSFNASKDTLLNDWQTLWSGKKMGEAFPGNRTFRDWTIQPLRTDDV